MDVIPILIAAAALYVLIPYVRCFFKYLSCMRQLQAVCQREGYELRGTYPLWFLGCRYGKDCDCCILTGSGVVAVKLFGVLRASRTLVFSDYRRYFFRAHPLFSLDFFDNSQYRLPDYDFACRLCPQWRGRPVRPVLLINPISAEIRIQPASGPESVSGPGDMLGNMELASQSHLIHLLENAGQASE